MSGAPPLMPGFGGRDPGMWSAFVARRKARREEMATQSWPRFFRTLAIQTAWIAAAVALVALVIFLLRG